MLVSPVAVIRGLQLRSHIKKPFWEEEVEEGLPERTGFQVESGVATNNNVARYCSNYENFTRTLRHYDWMGGMHIRMRSARTALNILTGEKRADKSGYGATVVTCHRHRRQQRWERVASRPELIAQSLLDALEKLLILADNGPVGHSGSHPGFVRNNRTGNKR